MTVVFMRLLICLFVVNTSFAADKVNVNSADAAQLASGLSGVGEKKAQQIVAWRNEYGEFKSLDDLRKVAGFGPKLIERNKDRIVFSSVQQGQLSRAAQHKPSNELSWPTTGYAR